MKSIHLGALISHTLKLKIDEVTAYLVQKRIDGWSMYTILQSTVCKNLLLRIVQMES
jgi:hypothetical protein